MLLRDCIKYTELNNYDNSGSINNEFTTRDRIYLESFSEDVVNEERLANEEVTYATDYAILNKVDMFGGSLYDFDENRNPTFRNIYRDPAEIKYGNFLKVNSNCDMVSCYMPMEEEYNIPIVKTSNAYDGVYTSYDGGALRPTMQLDCDKIAQTIRMSPNNFKIIELNTPNGIEVGVELGEFPQTYVGNELNERLEMMLRRQVSWLMPTGKKYTGWIDAPKDCLKMVVNKYPEYICKGEKYVRLRARARDGDSKLSTGEFPFVDSYKWCKVEPIKWQILNWKKLPQSINPNGTNTDSVIKVRTAECIVSGIPFAYIGRNSALGEANSALWQNSIIRAYFNGYDLIKEVVQNGNGCDKVLVPSIDFTQYSFIDQAFGDIELTKDLTPAEEIIQHSRRKRESRYGITIPNKPMSIDDQIRYYIDNRRPFMLHGKSGIGKSRRIADINPNFVSLTLRNGILPEEVIGKDTTDENGVSKWTPPSFYVELVKRCEENPDTNIVLFIDELTNVNEHEQSIVYDIVLNHSVKPNCGKLPDNCVVVAAGNSKEESDSAYNMPEPLFRRFHGHVYLPLDLESLLEWGTEIRKDNPEQTNLHPLISSYLSTYEDALYSNYDPEKTGKNYALDPRCWEQVSDLIYDNKGELWEELLANKIGEENASRLLAFAEKNFITIEDILEDNYDYEDIPTKLDEQYALALTLRHASEQEISKVREFVARHLSGETLAKFDYVWTNNNPERAMIIGQLQVEQEDVVSINPNPDGFPTLMKDKRIHIREFCEDLEKWHNSLHNPLPDEKVKVIKCNNEFEANMICRAFRVLGKTWRSGQSYDNTNWDKAIDHLCYTNYGVYGDYEDYEDNYTVYDFYDVDFSGVLSKSDIDYIESSKGKEILD